jgi:hypothetical protein
MLELLRLLDTTLETLEATLDAVLERLEDTLEILEEAEGVHKLPCTSGVSTEPSFVSP